MTFNGKPLAQVAQELDAILTRFGEREQVEAMCVAIDVAGSRALLAYGENGRRRPDADRPLFAVGCLLDFITAVVCLDLSHSGGLDLDRPFEELLPEAVASAAEGERPITVGQLLTRTSGIQDPRTVDEMWQGIAWDDLAPRIQAAARIFSPGAVFSYGGADRIMMTELLTRFSGKSLARLAGDIILRPTGVTQRAEQLGEPAPDGHPTVARFDCANFATIVSNLASETPRGAHNPFSREVRYFLEAERVPLSRSVRNPPWPHAATGFTMGLFRYSDGLIGCNGFDLGDSCAVRYDPVGHVTLVVGLHGRPGDRDVVVAQAAQALGYRSVQSRAMPCTVGSLNGVSPEEIVGVYEGWADGYRSNVAIEDGMIVCEQEYRGEHFRRLRARLEDGGWLTVGSAVEIASFEFFRDPGTGRVCLAAGYLPFAKAA